jgi:hypothetical protein
LPLGSPFGKLAEDKRLENRISSARIKEIFSDDDNKLSIYDYDGDEIDDREVQAYVIHYPIVEMKLDLEAYVRDAIKDEDDTPFSYTIPDEIMDHNQQFPLYFAGAQGPQISEGAPLFRISLADMANLVKEVDVNDVGLEMMYDNEDFAKYVRVKIPAFGINDYINGEKDGNILRFINTPENKFIPKSISRGGNLSEKNEIEIFVMITGACSGTIAPEMIFEWTSAIIDASGDPIEGSHPITNELRDFLGKGAAFKKVNGYIYVGGIESDAFMSLFCDNETLAYGDLISKERPQFPIAGHLPLHSLGSEPDGIDFTEVFNSESTLNYEIKIEEWPIINDGDQNNKTITADLVILLPLELLITNPPGHSVYAEQYSKLELGEDLFSAGNGDLSFRDGNDDDLLNNIETMKIILEKLENNIMGNINLLIASDNGYHELLDLTPKSDGPPPSLEIQKDDLKYPFTPRFEILLKKDENGDAILKIKRLPQGKSPVFDFFLAVEAQVNIDHKINF